MRITVILTIILCWLFSAVSVEARGHRGHGLPWCGIYMGKYFGKSDRSLWVARNWAREGSPAHGPGEGVVVVWPHHVGVIVGRDASGEWLVHSGNDGNAVRTRPRSLRGAIAFRQVGSGSGSAYVDLKGQEQAVRGRNKHLVALTVEGGQLPQPRISLKQSRATANVTGEAFASLGDAASFTPPADRAYEALRKKRKSVMERERMFIPLFAPMPEPVGPTYGKQLSIHSSPHIQRDQAGADHPSSRASLRSEARTHRASLSSGSAEHGRVGGAGVGWHEYRPDLI